MMYLYFSLRLISKSFPDIKDINKPLIYVQFQTIPTQWPSGTITLKTDIAKKNHFQFSLEGRKYKNNIILKLSCSF